MASFDWSSNFYILQMPPRVSAAYMNFEVFEAVGSRTISGCQQSKNSSFSLFLVALFSLFFVGKKTRKGKLKINK